MSTRLEPGDILALFCAAAGWFYLFYSRAAARLAALEEKQANWRRIRLRRICGGAMFLLAVGLYSGFHAVDVAGNPKAFLAVWLAVLLLLFAVVVLALADVRLTARLRRRHDGENRS